MQIQQIDKLLDKAKHAQNQQESLQLRQQAVIIAPNDPLAVETLANHYWQMGEYHLAINTYQQSWIKIHQIYLGNIALRASQTELAKQYFDNSNRESESAQSQAGLATVAFIENRPDQGCNHADRAKKLNLSSATATNVGEVCAIFNQKSTRTDRAQANLLINSFIFESGLAKLEAIPSKTTSDWQLISAVYASRGELGKASDAIKSGLEQAPADQELLRAIIKLNTIQGNQSQNSLYQSRLQDTELW